jgi:beta-galactosidase
MQLGVCYYPEQWPESYWSTDAARMVEMGISHVRIAEFAWSCIEPEAGRFDWAWLDRVVQTLSTAGLKIIMCTPTATPPKWLVDSDASILAIDANGQPKRAGSRRHYCFSSAAFRVQSKRISTAVAQRYGQHPAVVAWQTDNEYGCHFTVQSFSLDARNRFRKWLAKRYVTIDKLNAAWGNVFWSQTYRNFDEIDPPFQSVTEAHPALRLDWKRFGSDEVVEFNREQVEIIRRESPGRLITHNFMGFFTEFDHYKVSKDLDVASLDSYPIGFTQMFFLNDQEKYMWAETGHPDIPSFHYDLYRGMCAQNKWWVMEQQPGPVNWAHWNPIPKDGMVRLWTWQAMAHGCGLVSYFRWRQAPFAQEQMHAGLLMPDSTDAQGALEVNQLSKEIKNIVSSFPHGLKKSQAEVALVFDYDSIWMAEIQPQGIDYNALELVFRLYSTLRSLGLDVDIISSRVDLSGYRLIVLAAQWHIEPTLQIQLEQLEKSKTHMLIAPRAGSKSEYLSISEPLPPGVLSKLIGAKVLRVGSLPPSVNVPLFSANKVPSDGKNSSNSPIANVSRWIEELQCIDASPLWVNAKGKPIVVRKDKVTYVGAWIADADWQNLLIDICANIDLKAKKLAQGLRLSHFGKVVLATNFSDQAISWQPNIGAVAAKQQTKRILLGEETIPPQGIAIWQVC